MNKPHYDARGRFTHLCMSPTRCNKQAAFGFDGGALWLCGEHRSEHTENKKQQDIVSRETVPERQGRLL